MLGIKFERRVKISRILREIHAQSSWLLSEIVKNKEKYRGIGYAKLKLSTNGDDYENISHIHQYWADSSRFLQYAGSEFVYDCGFPL